MKVLLGPDAVGHVEQIDAWWRENRPRAPDLFRQELAAMLHALAEMPSLGSAYARTSVPRVRRTTLRTTRYHVYYRVVSESVHVLAVWSAVRGAGPDLAECQ